MLYAAWTASPAEAPIIFARKTVWAMAELNPADPGLCADSPSKTVDSKFLQHFAYEMGCARGARELWHFGLFVNESMTVTQTRTS
ncbi:hypothetical protein N7486_010604 [Penicillium sp. IBT 16267x]|nr:hypothetical protein N7486_010604 [Penicillium sp. IBT 16267x]